jgi:hypothetical protein
LHRANLITVEELGAMTAVTQPIYLPNGDFRLPSTPASAKASRIVDGWTGSSQSLLQSGGTQSGHKQSGTAVDN